jgi:MOSC domain-containing protein YiiM
MFESSVQLSTLLCGPAVPFTRAGSRSAIAKTPVGIPRQVRANGIEGDEQGDLSVHGGVEKAVHHYAFDHYPAWRDQVNCKVLETPGAFGENFSTLGWSEKDVNLGDIVEVGTCVLQISQPRQPCWKLNDRFGDPRIAAMVLSTGRTGWYYRVLREGWVEPGNLMSIVERPFPDWSIRQLGELLFHQAADRGLLEAASRLPLPASWQMLIRHRLDRQRMRSRDSRPEARNR